MDSPGVPDPLSAKYKNTFAYATVKDRLPVILAKIADTVHRSKNWVKDEYGVGGQDELKVIAGCISKLRNELQTSKPILPIQDGRSDNQVWNDYLREVTERNGAPPSWFTSPWLYVECYMYRRVEEAVEKSIHLKKFDVFMEQKQKSLSDSVQPVLILCEYLMSVTEQLKEGKVTDLHKLFRQFTQLALWGNKCDLSISGGSDNAQTSCPLDQVTTLSDYILIDDLDKVWNRISGQPAGRVDIILDNAGFEVVTDMCLAEFLVSANLATSIHFHHKVFPWFVSDVTRKDWDHTLKFFMQSNSLAMSTLVSRWKDRLENGSWRLDCHDYWTESFDYSEMKTRSPDLYEELSKSSLIIFKGDLNYRKLVGDLDWPKTTSFEESLRGFHPAPLCSLRTLKADLVTGLKAGQVEKTTAKDEQWMVSGNWAVMSYCDKVVVK